MMHESGRTIGTTYYKLFVMADGFVFTTAEGPTPMAAHEALTTKLEELASKGQRPPEKALLEGEVGKKIGFIRFSTQHLDARPLIP